MLAMLRQTLGKTRIVSGESQYAPHHVGEVVDADTIAEHLASLDSNTVTKENDNHSHWFTRSLPQFLSKNTTFETSVT